MIFPVVLHHAQFSHENQGDMFHNLFHPLPKQEKPATATAVSKLPKRGEEVHTFALEIEPMSRHGACEDDRCQRGLQGSNK